MKPSPRWTIYCHTHTESGRRYVGLTRFRWQRRWSQHCSKSIHAINPKNYFYNAIRKYGKEAFSHEVLEICHSLEVANLAEECWIELLDTRNPEKGFNLARGGEHVPHPVKNPFDRPGFREARIADLARANATITPQERSARAKDLWSDPQFREKVIAANISSHNTPEYRENGSRAAKEVKARPGMREKQSSISRAMWTDEFRVKNAELWKDPDFRARCQSGLVRGAAMNAAKTHCKNGHEYTAENTRWGRNGRRSCRMCHQLHGKLYMRAKRARDKLASSSGSTQ